MKRKVKVSKEVAKKILLSVLGGSTIALGAQQLVSRESIEANPEPAMPPEPIEPGPIDCGIPTAQKVNDDMSFGDAFAAARQEVGEGGQFTWNGDNYNTFYKEEWDAMSEADQLAWQEDAVDNAAEVAANDQHPDLEFTIENGALQIDMNGDNLAEYFIADIDNDGQLDVIENAAQVPELSGQTYGGNQEGDAADSSGAEEAAPDQQPITEDVTDAGEDLSDFTPDGGNMDMLI